MSATPALTEPPRTAASLSRTALWLILGLVLLADALDMIDSTVTNIAAPTIVNDIGGGASLIKWLGSAYALAMGVLLVIGGRLGDKYGQRRLFLIGMAGFTAASAVAGLSPDPALLVVARAVQGAFGALMIPQGMAILTKTFPRDMLRKAFQLFGPLLGLASVGGPVLAGFVIDADFGGLSWRPVFLINLALGVLGLFAATRLLPKDDGDRGTSVDGWGAGLLAVTMFGLMFGLIEGSTYGWSALSLGSLAVGVVFLALFVRRQRTAAEPLIKPTLLRNKGFTSGLFVGLLYFAVTSGLTYVISLFLQQGLHASPGDTALGMLPLTLGIIVAAFAGMALAAKLGRTLILIGMLLTLAGAGWLLALVLASGLSVGLWALAPAVFLTGLGMGACFGTIFDIALGDIDPDEAGSASGSLTAIQQLANGIGSATVTTVYFHFLPGGSTHAMTISLIVVLATTAACLPALRLLPRKAQEGAGHH
ncbi:MFS transporter [Streptomyces sp. TRM66268-LWL]|uniref:MFS transporter n=1 Tax=Streptomyces polyasparticus TaxID=2767826 RepID=A0ABR7SGS6_9ACTN|nr:MFS transporter [Streptomyces polyasparticus]MBC9714695.1 MFS transporter [Streptomyces polyasparticus]